MFNKSILAFASLIALSAATIAPIGSASAEDAPISTVSATTESTPETTPAPVPKPMQAKGMASVQSVLDDLVQGKTDLVQLQPTSRVNLMQQPGMLPSLAMRLQSFGALQSVTFAGMQNGREIYDVRFASASMLIAAAIAPDGKISAINWKFH